jgi:hypothetical protein
MPPLGPSDTGRPNGSAKCGGASTRPLSTNSPSSRRRPQGDLDVVVGPVANPGCRGCAVWLMASSHSSSDAPPSTTSIT